MFFMSNIGKNISYILQAMLIIIEIYVHKYCFSGSIECFLKFGGFSTVVPDGNVVFG